MCIELTEEQRQAVLNGDVVRFAGKDIGTNVVLLREDLYEALLEDQKDRMLQAAFLQSSHQAAVGWMKENPY